MFNAILVALIGMLAIGSITAYSNLQQLSNRQTDSYLYTDLAVEALDDLYQAGQLSKEDFLEMKKKYTDACDQV